MNRSTVTSIAILFSCCGLFCSAYAAPPIEAYGHLPSVDLMRLSPSGERYTFVAVLGESRTLAVVGTDDKAIYVTKVGDTKLRDIQWADENHVLATTSSTYKQPLDFVRAYELATVINIRPDHHASSAIFDKSRSVARAVFGYFGAARSEGSVYGYFGGITFSRNSLTGDYFFERGYRDLYRVDLDSGKPGILAKGGEHDHQWVVAADGSVVAHSEYYETSGEWRLYAGKNRDKLLLSRISPTDDIDLVGQGRSVGTVLVVDNSGVEDVALEVSIADGKQEPLFDSFSTNRFLFDPMSGLLIGAITEQEPGAHFFDAKLQARYNGARKAFPAYQIRLESYSSNLDRLIVLTEGADDSGTYWMVDIATGKAREIGHPYPEIRRKDVGPVRTVNYSAADGTPIEGILTLPPGRVLKKLPLVVMPHGGPIGIRDRVGFDWQAQAFASAGYAVLQPNYRGSSGYDRAFRQAGFGQWGGKMLSDISAGIAPLALQGIIDPRRVCIVGGSYGGYAALAGVTLQKGIYRCAVSVAGVSDMPAMFRYDSLDRGVRSSAIRYLRAATGADKEGDDVLRVISPATFAKQADAPILLIHGKDDTVVPISQSQTMASALKSANKQFEFVVMKGEDHHLSREETRITMLKAAVDFVKRFNPPD
ncbi:alpha/beta hydrolase family protein [Stenotrophobium rhamnosiphilum]|uniref:S9 family peptidase n=1 Tax=Stenotrophobium rhamnosiphilum TaxID=2029166 RepID=A0A2T5MBN5_9GAMM|nr:S9 family peptidase [Stenotrophobium rhamnosiphilum]PTU29142.1 S9 family peptidase [Stenotrophobium rhamnosiphilum]